MCWTELAAAAAPTMHAISDRVGVVVTDNPVAGVPWHACAVCLSCLLLSCNISSPACPQAGDSLEAQLPENIDVAALPLPDATPPGPLPAVPELGDWLTPQKPVTVRTPGGGPTLQRAVRC